MTSSSPTWTIDKEKGRLDLFLVEQYPEWSRSQIQSRIKKGEFKVNGAQVHPGYLLKPEDSIEGHLSEEQKLELEACEGPLEILYEDDDFMAVNKAAGWLSHPNPGSTGGSILNILKGRGIELEGGEDPMRKGLVHRLDRETSGVLLLGKTASAWQSLQKAFSDRLVQKRYFCLAYGAFRRMEFQVDLSMSRHPKRRNTQYIDPEGRSASTSFKICELFNERSALIEAQPHTGRTHQIRVHLQSQKISIFGDPVYAGGLPAWATKAPRTLLHCEQLIFPHPKDQREMSIVAPRPEDFEKATEALRKNGTLEL